MKIAAALAFAGTLAVSHATGVFAQGFQGGLRGSVKDSGGVIPGVEVTLTNEQTTLGRSTVTNERGEYAFASVDPGTYTVKASLQGYKTIERGSIRIATQSFLVLDLLLEVGTITENVTVTGDSALVVQTQTPSIATNLTGTQITSLPLSSRNALDSLTSLPGFNTSATARNSTVNGLPKSAINITLDGMSIQDN